MPTAYEKPSPEHDRSPLAEAWEIARYAPIGLLVEGPFLLPKLAQMGKAHIRNAQAVGRSAVRQGRTDLRRRLEQTDSQLLEIPRLVGLLPPSQAAADRRAPASADDAETSRDDVARADAAGSEARHRVDGHATAGPPGTTRTPQPSVGDLAIPDYDSLSAPQVVNRLSGLGRDELEAVRRYELAHRGRKTILNKVAQLQT